MIEFPGFTYEGRFSSLSSPSRWKFNVQSTILFCMDISYNTFNPVIRKGLPNVSEQSLLLRKSEKFHYPRFTDRKDTILRSELSCLRSHTRREWLHGIKPILLNPCLVTQSQDSLLYCFITINTSLISTISPSRNSAVNTVLSVVATLSGSIY